MFGNCIYISFFNVIDRTEGGKKLKKKFIHFLRCISVSSRDSLLIFFFLPIPCEIFSRECDSMAICPGCVCTAVCLRRCFVAGRGREEKDRLFFSSSQSWTKRRE